MTEKAPRTSNNAVALSNPWAVVPPLGNLDAYISAVNRLPMLTLEEEQRYARELRDTGSLDAAGPDMVHTGTKSCGDAKPQAEGGAQPWTI